MLTAYQKKKLIEFINKQVIDVTELSSYRNHGHPNQNFARFAEPDEEDWDLDEEYRKQGEEAIDAINSDGLWEWTQLPDELKEEAIKFIAEETGCDEIIELKRDAEYEAWLDAKDMKSEIETDEPKED